MRRPPRPPPARDGAFAQLAVLPELAGQTVDQVAATTMGVRLYCRACGRDVVVTPAALRQLPEHARTWSIERFTAAARCGTCGRREAQASGWPLEPGAAASAVIVRQDHWRGPRRDL